MRFHFPLRYYKSKERSRFYSSNGKSAVPSVPAVRAPIDVVSTLDSPWSMAGLWVSFQGLLLGDLIPLLNQLCQLGLLLSGLLMFSYAADTEVRNSNHDASGRKKKSYY